jgi:hypothetical protein
VNEVAPVPPFATWRVPEMLFTETEEVPMRVPFEFAYTYWLVRPARVVEPVFEIEKRVVVPTPLEEDAMEKRTVGLEMPVVVEVKRVNLPKGVVVPIPTAPPY